MPLYEYKCRKCARHTEKIESVAGPHLTKCPHCGGKVESVITAPAIKFKGAGWYVNDYAGKSSAGEAKSETDSGESKDNKDGAKDPAAKDSSAKESGAKDPGSKETGSKESKEKKPAKKK